jgi:hypothetical protein
MGSSQTEAITALSSNAHSILALQKALRENQAIIGSSDGTWSVSTRVKKLMSCVLQGVPAQDLQLARYFENYLNTREVPSHSFKKGIGASSAIDEQCISCLKSFSIVSDSTS